MAMTCSFHLVDKLRNARSELSGARDDVLDERLRRAIEELG